MKHQSRRHILRYRYRSHRWPRMDSGSLLLVALTASIRTASVPSARSTALFLRQERCSCTARRASLRHTMRSRREPFGESRQHSTWPARGGRAPQGRGSARRRATNLPPPIGRLVTLEKAGGGSRQAIEGKCGSNCGTPRYGTHAGAGRAQAGCQHTLRGTPPHSSTPAT